MVLKDYQTFFHANIQNTSMEQKVGITYDGDHCCYDQHDTGSYAILSDDVIVNEDGEEEVENFHRYQPKPDHILLLTYQYKYDNLANNSTQSWTKKYPILIAEYKIHYENQDDNTRFDAIFNKSAIQVSSLLNLYSYFIFSFMIGKGSFSEGILLPY